MNPLDDSITIKDYDTPREHSNLNIKPKYFSVIPTEEIDMDEVKNYSKYNQFTNEKID